MSVHVIMRDGRTYEGPLWEWRPLDGWFTLVYDCDDGPDDGRIWLRDVVSAVDRDQRTRIGVIEDLDLVAKARAEGWR